MTPPTLFSVAEALEPIAPWWAKKIKTGKINTRINAKRRLNDSGTCIGGEAWGWSREYATKSLLTLEPNPKYCKTCTEITQNMFEAACPFTEETCKPNQAFLSHTMTFIKHFSSKHKLVS